LGGGGLSPFLTKSIFASDPLFSKTLSGPPLPTEPQLLNSEPCVPNPELRSVEKELSTEPLTT